MSRFFCARAAHPSIEIEIPNREPDSEVLAVEFGEDFDSPITVSTPSAIELRPLTNPELPAISPITKAGVLLLGVLWLTFIKKD